MSSSRQPRLTIAKRDSALACHRDTRADMVHRELVNLKQPRVSDRIDMLFDVEEMQMTWASGIDGENAHHPHASSY